MTIQLGYGQATVCPFLVGGLKRFALISLVAIPQEIPVGAGERAGFVGFPQEPNLKIPGQSLHMDRWRRSEHLGKASRGSAKFGGARRRINEVEALQAAPQPLISSQVRKVGTQARLVGIAINKRGHTWQRPRNEDREPVHEVAVGMGG